MSVTTHHNTQSVLEAVRRRGRLRAVVSQGIRGLSIQDSDGSWSGLDTDLARAVAAATLGDSSAISWMPTDPADRLERLTEDEADLVTCNLSWTLGREATAPVLFPGITCFDGEGFLVRIAEGVGSPEDLEGQPLAVQAGTTSAANLDSWFGARGLAVKAVSYSTPAEALAAYARGECRAYVLDRVALAGERASLPDPDAHSILETTISREPMAMAVRDTDPAWFRVCRWVLQFLISAEYAAVDLEGRAKREALQAAARTAGKHGPAMGLDTDWADRVLQAVGTYGDIYDRNLGPDTGLDVPRGLNALWIHGGQHYAIPLH